MTAGRALGTIVAVIAYANGHEVIAAMVAFITFHDLIL